MMTSNRKTVERPKLLVAAESFSLVRGGIARTGRLLARLAADIGLEADLLALTDPQPTTDFGLPARTAAGSRAGFALRCWTGGVTRSRFMYNHVGISRAHCPLPMLDQPYALWIYGVEVWGPRMLGDYGRQVRDANLLLSITDFTRQRAAKLLPSAARAKVCWLATEEDDIPETPSDVGGPPTALILSRIDATQMRKGHYELIDCWPSVMAAIPNARLLIAGGGDGLEILRARARASTAASNIEFTGLLPQSQIDALWSRAHVFVMPSRQDGFGIVYVEAMRRGLPVIASTHDAGQEINLHGVTGYNVNLDRDSELASRIVELLSNKALARQFGENGREHWRANFCFSAFRRRMEPIMAEFLAA
jgi:phosphatidylinositol alpha-1,6-mannosyltransferase